MLKLCTKKIKKMSNDEIIEALELTAKLMELHDGDVFKIKTYNAAAYSLNRLTDVHLATMSIDELSKLQSVGKGTAAKMIELVQTGQLKELDELTSKTPQGVLDMFNVKGIGPKKISTIWRELGIDNLRELELACQNGQIAKLKGFGENIQQKILDSLAFLQSQVGKLRMNKADELVSRIELCLEPFFEKFEKCGQMVRRCETIDTIQFIVATNSEVQDNLIINSLEGFVQDIKSSSPFVWRGKVFEIEVAIEIWFVAIEKSEQSKFILNSSENHLATTLPSGGSLMKLVLSENVESEQEIYQKAGLPFIIPEMREGRNEFDWASKNTNDDLITWEALKGCVHNHSTYSDGKHSLRIMAEFCKGLGLEYFGIADHSRSATYASGLPIEKVIEQQLEIDKLNLELAPFKILKGIESDILGDGSLDYPDDILATFDYVVASVHSNLTMNQEKAMSRLIKAIENPYTTILGHPTGRLLLSREGYPIDHQIIIDACAANGVVLELNASPWRLDLDWRWIDYAMEKGVMISINPDAHSTAGFNDMRYGVDIARKGGLTKAMTFNALGLNEVLKWKK